MGLDQSGELLRLVMVLSTTRNGRMGPRVANYVKKELGDKYNISVIDPAELDLPLLDKPIHHYGSRAEAPAVLRETEDRLTRADALLFVTAEYNMSVPPALSNLLDHLTPGTPAFDRKPAAIVSYSMGQLGGVNAQAGLRVLLSAMGTVVIPESKAVGSVHAALDEAGTPQAGHERLQGGMADLHTQLHWYATALRNHRLATATDKHEEL